jgi:hypothetical protein
MATRTWKTPYIVDCGLIEDIEVGAEDVQWALKGWTTASSGILGTGGSLAATAI